MSLFLILAELEADIDLHLGRLLVLMGAFAGRKGEGEIRGLTKLAKLDFLLRYPLFLERALTARAVTKPANIGMQDYERLSVESRMVRFKYGPWDFRYRRLINILVARGLVHVDMASRTVSLSLTSKGMEAAQRLSSTREYADIRRRARLLRQHFDIQGTKLMRFVYQTFPEITTLRFGEEIAP